eukprot:scaffold15564_cov203-Skeletonema_dohrnii-CCMP3373.AAC.1
MATGTEATMVRVQMWWICCVINAFVMGVRTIWDTTHNTKVTRCANQPRADFEGLLGYVMV